MLPEHVTRGCPPPPGIRSLQGSGRSRILGLEHPLLQSSGVHHGVTRIRHGRMERDDLDQDHITVVFNELDNGDSAPALSSDGGR